MIFFALLASASLAWFAPWWMTALFAVLAGYARPLRAVEAAAGAACSGVTWCALAYVQDARLAGLVSRRLGGLLGLPPLALIAVMGALGFVTVLLGLMAGGALKGGARRDSAA